MSAVVTAIKSISRSETASDNSSIEFASALSSDMWFVEIAHEGSNCTGAPAFAYSYHTSSYNSGCYTKGAEGIETNSTHPPNASVVGYTSMSTSNMTEEIN